MASAGQDEHGLLLPGGRNRWRATPRPGWLLLALLLVAVTASLMARACTAPRPVVVILGWGNQADELQGDRHWDETALVAALRATRGDGPLSVSAAGARARGAVLITNHPDPYGDIEANARAEAEQLRGFLRARGSQECDVVAFSMGGLIARTMIQLHPEWLAGCRVRHLVLLGTPNFGANPVLTRLQCLTNPLCGRSSEAGRQMSPASDFLATLNAAPPIDANTSVLCVGGDVRVRSGESFVPLASDGFIRCTSVFLRAPQARNLTPPVELDDIYHCPAVEGLLAAHGRIPLVEGRRLPTTDAGRIIVGEAPHGTWYFDDVRVTTLLSSLD